MTRPNAHIQVPAGVPATRRHATAARPADAATFATTVQLPADPSGSMLATAIREIRLAMLRGDVIVTAVRPAAGPPARASSWTTCSA